MKLATGDNSRTLFRLQKPLRLVISRTWVSLIWSVSEQWYINFPTAIAPAMEFERGEVVEWVIEDKNKLFQKERLDSAHLFRVAREAALDHLPGLELAVCVDGSYTNRAVLKALPERVTLISRIRKDAALNQLPAVSVAREIEVNFRDEKTLPGCGEAQVRTPRAVTTVPAFVFANYAFLHLAAHRSSTDPDHPMLPRPK
jgi:hypothetical protein